jgi:hypothetical protein
MSLLYLFVNPRTYEFTSRIDWKCMRTGSASSVDTSHNVVIVTYALCVYIWSIYSKGYSVTTRWVLFSGVLTQYSFVHWHWPFRGTCCLHLIMYFLLFELTLKNELRCARYCCVVGTHSTLSAFADLVNCVIYLRISLLKQICLKAAVYWCCRMLRHGVFENCVVSTFAA